MEQCFAKFVKRSAKTFLLLVVRETSKDRHFCGTKNLRIIVRQTKQPVNKTVTLSNEVEEHFTFFHMIYFQETLGKNFPWKT